MQVQVVVGAELYLASAGICILPFHPTASCKPVLHMCKTTTQMLIKTSHSMTMIKLTFSNATFLAIMGPFSLPLNKENSGKAFGGTHHPMGNHQGCVQASGNYFYSSILNTVSFQLEFTKG